MAKIEAHHRDKAQLVLGYVEAAAHGKTLCAQAIADTEARYAAELDRLRSEVAKWKRRAENGYIESVRVDGVVQSVDWGEFPERDTVYGERDPETGERRDPTDPRVPDLGMIRCPECAETDVSTALDRDGFLECSYCKHVFANPVAERKA